MKGALKGKGRMEVSDGISQGFTALRGAGFEEGEEI